MYKSLRTRGGNDGRDRETTAKPQLSDGEIASLFDFLWAMGTWEAEFQKVHGRAPTDQDRADRAWSLDFAAKNGRSPGDADWIARSVQSKQRR